jgi:hypothetical protein
MMILSDTMLPTVLQWLIVPPGVFVIIVKMLRLWALDEVRTKPLAICLIGSLAGIATFAVWHAIEGSAGLEHALSVFALAAHVVGSRRLWPKGGQPAWTIKPGDPLTPHPDHGYLRRVVLPERSGPRPLEHVEMAQVRGSGERD